MSPTGNGDTIFFNRGGLYSLTTEPLISVSASASPSMSPLEISGFTSGTNLLEREDLLSVVQNITPDSSPLVERLRSGNRSRYIEDNNGICMCYKHRRIWREGADFKKGRRPCDRPGGACKECVSKTII